MLRNSLRESHEFSRDWSVLSMRSDYLILSRSRWSNVDSMGGGRGVQALSEGGEASALVSSPLAHLVQVALGLVYQSFVVCSQCQARLEVLQGLVLSI